MEAALIEEVIAVPPWARTTRSPGGSSELLGDGPVMGVAVDSDVVGDEIVVGVGVKADLAAPVVEDAVSRVWSDMTVS